MCHRPGRESDSLNIADPGMLLVTGDAVGAAPDCGAAGTGARVEGLTEAELLAPNPCPCCPISSNR
jgi:hypothetical protein